MKLAVVGAAAVPPQPPSDDTPPALRQAWQAAFDACLNGVAPDGVGLAAAFAGCSAESILQLHEGSVLRRRAAQGSFCPTKGGGPEPSGSEAVHLPAMRQATNAALAAIQSKPALVPEQGPDSASILRQALWLAGATDQVSVACEKVSDGCGHVLESAAMAFIGINTNAEIVANLRMTIDDVAGEIARTSEAATAAAASTQEAGLIIGRLEQAAAEIGGVVEMIRRIASRTTMLALNATIEAARAGEAGRGFAVVASEVKTLAAQIAEATTRIDEMIRAVGEAVAAASSQMRQIEGATGNVQAMAANGTISIERQREAIGELDQSAQEAALAVGRMQDGIEQVACDMAGVSAATEMMQSGAEILKEKAKLTPA